MPIRSKEAEVYFEEEGRKFLLFVVCVKKEKQKICAAIFFCGSFQRK